MHHLQQRSQLAHFLIRTSSPSAHARATVEPAFSCPGILSQPPFSMNSALFQESISPVVNAAAKSHHSILDSNTNLRRVNGRLPLELIHNMLLQFCIGLHSNFHLLDHWTFTSCTFKC